jgi:methionyl-tRNA formyltransferase
MGSPAFALPTLGALLDAGHDVVAVYCQPPRPAGRGRRPQRAPVHEYAESRGLEVRTPARLRDDGEQSRFAALRLDVAVVAAYGLILPKRILEAPLLGCLNVHASLLPRWRGAAPIERAILAGDHETGVTIMLVEEGLDTGPMLLGDRVPIGPATTAPELRDTLAHLGAKLLLRALDGLVTNALTPRPQPDDGVTYAKKLERDEGRIDWNKPAAALERAVRALTPQPGVFFEHAGERIKVLAAGVVDADGTPGTVIDNRLTIACGNGALRALRLQRAGRGSVDAAAFLRGYPLPPGTALR